jgi:serine/threonine protein kinase
MAHIYLARAAGIGSFERHVVLKTILPDRADDKRFVDMFLDEARLAATLNHQNIAQVFEVGEDNGTLFITMEYVHGENLRTILETASRKGLSIPVELAVLFVSAAAAGLHHAHERKGKTGQPLNIVHRDVSPANIMVGYDGAVKILDFGIAKAEERATKTQQGTIKGKYGYMSPEQCRGKPLDRRTDIFALGIVLYEITTLRRAFRGRDDFDTMKRIVKGDIMPASMIVPGFPPELEVILSTALAVDPNQRFQSAQELLEALDAFAVRSKLASSPSITARFMTQLFGTKREPWIEMERRKRPSEGPERTDITGPEVSVEQGGGDTVVLRGVTRELSAGDLGGDREGSVTARTQPPPARRRPKTTDQDLSMKEIAEVGEDTVRFKPGDLSSPRSRDLIDDKMAIADTAQVPNPIVEAARRGVTLPIEAKVEAVPPAISGAITAVAPRPGSAPPVPTARRQSTRPPVPEQPEDVAAPSRAPAGEISAAMTTPLNRAELASAAPVGSAVVELPARRGLPRAVWIAMFGLLLIGGFAVGAWLLP